MERKVVKVVARIGNIQEIGMSTLRVYFYDDGTKGYRWETPFSVAAGDIKENDERFLGRLEWIRQSEYYQMEIFKYDKKGKRKTFTTIGM